MVKKFLLLLSLIMLMGCYHKNPVSPTGGFVSIAPSENPTPPAPKPDSLNPKPFFDFDEITHIRIDISDNEYDDLYNHKKGTPERNLVYFLSKNRPEEITDSAIEESIKNVAHKIMPVDPTFFTEMKDSIFAEHKSSAPPLALACEPIYRDILIFKMNKKTVGIAKICFKCCMYHITGAKSNTGNFGQYRDFKRLADLLKKNEALSSPQKKKQ